MKSFYTTGNRLLSDYMREQDGRFAAGTIMDRSEQELSATTRIRIINYGINLYD